MRPTVEGDNHAGAVAITVDFLGSLARSAYNLSAKDERAETTAKLANFEYRMFDGLRVIGKVGVDRGKLDEAGERWPDKNIIVAGITKDNTRDWSPWGPVVQDGPNDGLAGAMTPSSSSTPPIDTPPWAKD